MFYPYFFFLSVFFVFFFYRYFLTDDTNESQDYREGRRSPYFSCFPLPPAQEYSFSSSRPLPLLFKRSICNYQTDTRLILLRDLHFICIFIDAIKSELLTLTFQSDIELSNYHPSITKRTP